MSDDTPTERFEPPAPAAPLDASTPTAPTTPPPASGSAAANPESKKTRGLLIALIVVGALLVIAIIVLLVLLLRGGATRAADATPTGSSTPSASATPTSTATNSASPSPTATATTAPPPPSSGPTLTSFSSSTDVSCNAAKNPIPLAFSWTGTGAAAYFAVGSTSDPKNNGQDWTLPPTGSQADFPADQEILYPCNQATATYSIGVYDNSGHKAVKQLVVTNHGTVD